MLPNVDFRVQLNDHRPFKLFNHLINNELQLSGEQLGSRLVIGVRCQADKFSFRRKIHPLAQLVGRDYRTDFSSILFRTFNV